MAKLEILMFDGDTLHAPPELIQEMHELAKAAGALGKLFAAQEQRRKGAVVANQSRRMKSGQFAQRVRAEYQRLWKMGWRKKTAIYNNLAARFSCSESHIRNCLKLTSQKK